MNECFKNWNLIEQMKFLNYQNIFEEYFWENEWTLFLKNIYKTEKENKGEYMKLYVNGEKVFVMGECSGQRAKCS